MNKVKATVIIPTTIDRGMLLPYSIGSVQKQTIQDFEIFIIGDGVYDETREIINNLMSNDKRIKFFDHPKHERRGEVYRHMALQEAKGEIVCYLCDRDLMLPNHIETHLSILENYDFSCSACLNIRSNGEPSLLHFFGFFGPYSECDENMRDHYGGLSIVAHTLSFYLEQGIKWTTTPIGKATDSYMWKKFLDHPACNAFSINKTTLLYFHRQSHPGWTSEERLPEIAYWFNLLEDKDMIDSTIDQALQNLILRAKSLQIRINALTQPNRWRKLIYHLKSATYQILMMIRLK